VPTQNRKEIVLPNIARTRHFFSAHPPGGRPLAGRIHRGKKRKTTDLTAEAAKSAEKNGKDLLRGKRKTNGCSAARSAVFRSSPILPPFLFSAFLRGLCGDILFLLLDPAPMRW
jgi:hypothetical protein